VPPCRRAAGLEQLHRYLIIVAIDVVTQFAGVQDRQVVVERAVLPKGELSQRAKFVERNDFCDFGIPIVGVARRRGPTLLSQPKDLRAVTKSLPGSGDLTKLTRL